MTREQTERELRDQSGETMRVPDRDEDFIVTREGKVVPKVFANLSWEDYEQFRAEADAFFDPSLREWPDA